MDEEFILEELELGTPRETASAAMPEAPAAEATAAPPAESADSQGEEQAAAPPVELPPERQYCTFRAGSERYCMSVLDVEEIVEWPKVTPVPLAPQFLMGIFNLRGTIVPVVDIAFVDGRPADMTPKRVVVGLLPAEDAQGFVRLGIAADEVLGTYTTIEPLEESGLPNQMPHCCGLLREGEKLAMALDLKRVAEVFPVPVI